MKKHVEALILLLLFSPSFLYAQNIPFTLRANWDGPYDIKMVSGINLQPVFINPTQAQRGGTNQGYLLADSLITNGIMQRTGDLFEINNRYKDGSSNSVFDQYDIPLPAILCKNDPNVGGCILGLDPSSNNSSCPAPATRYNSSPKRTSGTYVSMTYSDYDQDNSTFSSSMATLDISSCSEIEAAYLYWAGNFKGSNKPITLIPGPLNSYTGSGDVFNASSSPLNYNTVKFKIPGGNYQNVTATTRYTSSTTYICVADVTNMLNGLQGGGEFWVGDLRTYPIEGNGGSTSGWTLVVVFRSPLSPPRLINLWDGFKNIESGDDEVFNLTGLQAPATANFKSYVGFAALDGENLATQLDGDTPEGLGFKTNGGAAVNINPFATDQPRYKLYNKKGFPATCNEGNNIDSDCRAPLYDNNWCSVYDGVSSSHITSYDEITGLNGNEITRIPNNINTLGYDAHHMILPPGAVSPGATNATLTVRAGPQGSTLPFLAYVAIERLQPKLVMTKTADKDATGLSTQIQYSLTIKNEGNAPSLGGDIIYDTLDAATTFVSGSLNASKAGVTLEANANNRLQIKIANSIAKGDSVIIQFLVDVIPFSSNPSLFNPPNCKRTIENTAFIEYNTISSGILQNKSNSNDCGVGNETRVVLVDEQLASSTTTPLGPFDGCNIDSDDAFDRIRTELLNNGVSASMLNQFDLRDSNYVRIRPGDVFGEIENEKVYFAIQDITGGASCQEVYELTFKCEQCSVSVTSPPKIPVCSGTALNYTITTDVTNATFNWSRKAVTGISNPSISSNTTNPITETLINTSSDSLIVSYEITPIVTNCIGVPFELEVSVIPVAKITNVEVDDVICSELFSSGFSLTSNVTNATFDWQSNTINVIGASMLGTTSNIPSEKLTTTIGGKVIYTVTPSLGGMCPGISKDFTVTVNPNPVVTANSNASANTICEGKEIILNGAGAGTGATYVWDNSVSDGVAFSPTESTIYKLKGIDVNGCEDTTSIVIMVNKLPTGTISGIDTICDDGTDAAVLLMTAQDYGPFDFYYHGSKSGTQISTNQNSPFTGFSTTENEIMTLDSIIDVNGCVYKAILNNNVAIEYHSNVTASVDFICKKSDATLTAEDVYVLELTVTTGDIESIVANTTGTIIAGPNSGSLVSFTAVGDGVFRSGEIQEDNVVDLIVKDKNGCNSIDLSGLTTRCSCPIEITDFSLASDSICENSATSINVSYQGASSGNYNITLTPPSGVSNAIVLSNESGPSSTFSAINEEGNYTVTAEGIDDVCTISGPTINLGYFENPKATITGGEVVCDGTVLELKIGLNSGKAPFTADVLVGALTLSVNSSTLLPIDSAKLITNISGVYTLDNLKDANGCTTTSSALNSTTSVAYIEQPTAEITNPNSRSKTISTNHFQLENAVVPSGYNGTWSNKGMGNINQNGYLSGLNKTVETDGLSAATSVIVWEVNDDGHVCPNATDTVDIIRRDITSADAINDTICLSSTLYSQIPLSLPNTSIGEQAEWTAIGTAPTPAIGTTLEVTFTQVGTYKYLYRIYNPTLFDDLGNPIASTKTITIVVNDIPNVSLATIEGDSFGCINDIKNYKVIGVTNADNYQWILPSGFVGTSITNNIDVTLGSLLGGTIEVFASNTACGTNPIPVSLSVTDIRQIPQIQPIVDGLLEVCVSYSNVSYKITNTLTDANRVTWKWNNTVKLNQVIPTQNLILNTSDFAGLTSGLIEVIPMNECGTNEVKKGTLVVTILNEVEPKVSLSSDKLNNEFCLADNDLVTFTATPISGAGDNPTFEFVVNGTGERSPISVSTQFGTSVIQNTVIVIMTSDDACRSKDEATASIVMKNISPKVSLSLASDVCFGNQVTIYSMVIPEPTAGSSITWFNYSNEVFKAQNKWETTFTDKGNYVLSVTYDNGICQPVTPTDSSRFTIWEKPEIILPEFVLGEYYQVTISQEKETNVVVPITVTGITKDSMDYYWQGEGISNAIYKDLLITYLPNQEDIFDYQLTASNENFPSCKDEKTIEIQTSIPLNIPNAFSPNGDGVNDWWEIPGITRYPNAQVTIYNRWGHLIYDQIGYNATTAWKGDNYPVATYYYIIKLNSDVKSESLTGALTLTR